MNILKRAKKDEEHSQESKRKVLLQELKLKGVLMSRDGEPLDDLNYYELKHELVMRELIEQ